MEKFKLNEESIIKRMSDGNLSALYGGVNDAQSQSIRFSTIAILRDHTTDPLCICLAGCGCTSQTACDTCTAEF